MFIKKFTKRVTRVKSPTDPGRSVATYQWVSDGTSGISEAGKEFYADDDGWFDVPEPVGQKLLNAHIPTGAGETSSWMTPADAELQINAGFMADDDALFLDQSVPPFPPRVEATKPRKATGPVKKIPACKATSGK